MFGDALVRIKRSDYSKFLMMGIQGLPNTLVGWLDLAAAAKEIWPNALEINMAPEEYNTWLKENNKSADVQNFRLFAEEKAARLSQPMWTDHDHDPLDLY